MPYSNDYSDFQRWIDGIFNSASIVGLDSCHSKPIKIVFEGEKANETKSECNCHSCKDTPDPFAIRSVLSNRRKNAFTVVWEDGTTTVVHCQSGDEWDDEKALAMCFTKKALGNKGNFNDKFNDALDNKMKVIHTPESARETVLAGPCHYTNAAACEPTTAEIIVSETPSTETLLALGNDLTNIQGTLSSTAITSATNAFKNLVKELEKINEPAPTTYMVSLCYSDGESIYGKTCDSKEEAVATAKRLAEDNFYEVPSYYRLWMEGDKLVIDFGSYSKFITISGLTVDDWN